MCLTCNDTRDSINNTRLGDGVTKLADAKSHQKVLISS